jgi:hypothetical protein
MYLCTVSLANGQAYFLEPCLDLTVNGALFVCTLDVG